MKQTEITVMQMAPGFEDCLAGDETPICRYFNSRKVHWLISDPGIWFARFDEMNDDEQEGAFYNAYRPSGQRLTVEQRTMLADANRFNRMPLISCWSLFDEGDDADMWSKFGGGKGSICCVSTVGQLKRSLSVPNIPACYVRYYSEDRLGEQVDSTRPQMPVFYLPGCMEERTYHTTELVKRDIFRGEKEVRFICFGPGREMLSNGDEGCYVTFKDGQRPFARIVADSTVAPENRLKLEDMFGCRVTERCK